MTSSDTDSLRHTKYFNERRTPLQMPSILLRGRGWVVVPNTIRYITWPSHILGQETASSSRGISSHLENHKIPFRCHSIYIMELSTRSTWLSIYYLHSELQCLVHRRAQVIMHKSPLQWRVICAVFRNVMWREEWKFRILESNIHEPTVKAFDGGGWRRISLLFSYRVTPKWFERLLLPHFYHHITHIANKCTNALAI